MASEQVHSAAIASSIGVQSINLPMRAEWVRDYYWLDN